MVTVAWVLIALIILFGTLTAAALLIDLLGLPKGRDLKKGLERWKRSSSL